MLEVLPAGGGKDTALAALIERFGPGALLVLGDDLTDVAMFAAATTLRAAGCHVVVLAIGGGSETPAEVVAAADAAVEQEQVGEVLALLAEALAEAPPA